MIRIEIQKHQEQILGITVSGHAESAEKGKDLVCSAVSAIAFGLCNAVDSLDASHCKIEIQENTIKIQVLQVNETNQTILKTGWIELETVEESQKEFVQIKKMEV